MKIISFNNIRRIGSNIQKQKTKSVTKKFNIICLYNFELESKNNK